MPLSHSAYSAHCKCFLLFCITNSRSICVIFDSMAGNVENQGHRPRMAETGLTPHTEFYFIYLFISPLFNQVG